MAHAIQENDGDHGERLGQNWKYKKYFLLLTQAEQNLVVKTKKF